MTVFRARMRHCACRRLVGMLRRGDQMRHFLPDVLVTILPKKVGRATRVGDTSSQGRSRAGALRRANGRDGNREKVRVEREGRYARVLESRDGISGPADPRDRHRHGRCSGPDRRQARPATVELSTGERGGLRDGSDAHERGQGRDHEAPDGSAGRALRPERPSRRRRHHEPGKPVQDGVRVKLPAGATWDALGDDELRRRFATRAYIQPASCPCPIRIIPRAAWSFRCS